MLNTITNITTNEDAHTSGAYPKRPLTIVRGEGCYVFDDAGNRYLDATSGQGVTALGHSHPRLVEAITQQAQTLITCPEIFYNDQRAQLYELLASITPADLNRFFLCNSGTEAVEGTLKVARLLTGRDGIVSVKRGFHGRTLGALSTTWTKKYREPFANWQPNVTFITAENTEMLAENITKNTAAVIIEVIQGEGGVHPLSIEYLQAIRQHCNETGTLLIFDEIQTGFGRTGHWFASEATGVIPDIMAMGKAIAGGIPMGAVAWRETLGTIPRSTHGSTFGGNPLACATAIATIQTLRDENIIEHVTELSAWFVDELESRSITNIREIRARGLMIGIELRGRVTPILKALQERGILALPAGLNVLRLLPPLIITREQLLSVIDAIAEICGD